MFADVTGCVSDSINATVARPYFSSLTGYVNLFPFLTTILDDPDKARAILKTAKSKLLSKHGLLSVSLEARTRLNDPAMRKLVEGHENYWVGPVWININFMFLRALHEKYNALLGPEAVDVYQELRRNLIDNVGAEYERTGKLWESYHWEDGHGQGTAPFTGWTTLIVLIMAEQY